MSRLFSATPWLLLVFLSNGRVSPSEAINEPSPRGETKLALLVSGACESQDRLVDKRAVAALRAALVNGADPNQLSEGHRGLDNACYSPEALSLLLLAGANPNLSCKDGHHPLQGLLQASIPMNGGGFPTEARLVRALNLFAIAGADLSFRPLLKRHPNGVKSIDDYLSLCRRYPGFARRYRALREQQRLARSLP